MKAPKNCVALASLKGGVGKTTDTLLIADALWRMGLDVLGVDVEPQGDLSQALGNPVQFVPTGEKRLDGSPVLATDGHTVDDLVANDVPGLANLAAVTSQWEIDMDAPYDRGGPLFPGKVGQIRVIRSFDGLAETARTWSAADLTRLRRALTEPSDDGGPPPNAEHDVVLIDTTPGAGDISIQGVGAADAVILVGAAEPFAVQAADPAVRFFRKSLHNTVGRAPVLIGVTINRWRGTRVISQQQAARLTEEIAAMFPDQDPADLLLAPIPDREAIVRSQSTHTPISAQLARASTRESAADVVTAANEQALDLLARIGHPRYMEIAAAVEATKNTEEH